MVPDRGASVVLQARWVLPVSAPPLREGAVVVREGRIEWVGPAGELPISASAQEVLPRMDLGEAAILPGLVNTHTHLELSVLRGYCEEEGFVPWLRKLILAKYSRLDAAAYATSARWGAFEAIRSGVTCVGDGSDSGTVLGALLECGLRGIVFREVFGPDDREAGRSLEALEHGLAADLSRASGRVRVGISPHAPYTVSPALFRSVAELAVTRGLPLMVHAAESSAERLLLRDGGGPFAEDLRARGIPWSPPGVSTVKYLAGLGVLRARPLLVHAIDVDGADLDLVARSGAAVAHCPKSNAKLSNGIARLSGMLARGIRLGLGTDAPVSNNAGDILEEARFAVLLQRACGGEPSHPAQAFGARAALRLATLGGAEALGLDGDVGSIEPGKLADLCAVDLSGAHIQPVHDPEASIVFSASARDVVLTMVEGRVLYRDGRVLSLDEGALREELRAAVRSLGSG